MYVMVPVYIRAVGRRRMAGVRCPRDLIQIKVRDHDTCEKMHDIRPGPARSPPLE